MNQSRSLARQVALAAAATIAMMVFLLVAAPAPA